MPFQIKLHPQERIIEVVYPAVPTQEDVGEYLVQMKQLIDEQKSHWFCLVDQRSLTQLPVELLEQVAVANSYAVLHGMQRSARIVSSQAAAAQANSIGKTTGAIRVKVKTFVERGPALAWLKDETV
jgi:hypothetical protein